METPKLSRRHMLAGTGLAAAAWTAPSIVRLDVASALGSTVTSLTIQPLGALDSCVSITPFGESMDFAEPSFGPYGRDFDNTNSTGQGADLGPISTFTVTGLGPHSAVRVTARVCFADSWEASNPGKDTFEIKGGAPGSLSSLSGVLCPGLNDACMDFGEYTVMHIASTFVLQFEGVVKAFIEEYGIARVDLTLVPLAVSRSAGCVRRRYSPTSDAQRKWRRH